MHISPLRLGGGSGGATGNSGPSTNRSAHVLRMHEDAGDDSVASASSHSDTLRLRSPDGGVDGVTSIAHAAGSDVRPAALVTSISSSTPFPVSAPSLPSHSGCSPSLERAEHVGSSPGSNTASHDDSNEVIAAASKRHPLLSRSPSTDCPSPSPHEDIANHNSKQLLPTTNLGSPSPSAPSSKSPSPPLHPDHQDNGHIAERPLSPGQDDDSHQSMDIDSPRLVIRLPPVRRSKRPSDGAVSHSKRLKLSDANGKRKRIAVKKVAEDLDETDENDEDDDEDDDDEDDDIGTDEGDVDKAGDGSGNDDMVVEEEDTVTIPRLIVHGDKEVYLTMNREGPVFTNHSFSEAQGTHHTCIFS